MNKGKTIVPVLLGALLAASPVFGYAVPARLAADLAGANETGGGDSDGKGAFLAEADLDAGKLCYSLSAEAIATATMAHIHAGAAGANGPPVATLELTGGTCLDMDREVLKAIAAAPQNYYVNVHNGEFPGGAVRGQLSAK